MGAILSMILNIPKHWITIDLEKLFHWSNGEGLIKKNMKDGKFLVYGGNGVTGKHDEFLTKNESIVIGRVGAHCGNVYVSQKNSWVTDNAIYSKWNSNYVDLKFSFYYLSNIKLNRLAGGSGQPYLSQQILNTLLFPLPPLNEQKRIVSKLEELLTKFDAGIEYLKKTQILLKQYRQSILKYAFEGKLTEIWRKENTKKIKPTLEHFIDKSFTNKRESRIDYKSISNFIENFPSEWQKTPLYNVCLQINPGFPSGKHNKEGKGIPHIRPMNINSKGELDLSIVKYVQQANCDKLKKGDVLFNNTNSPPLLGKTTYIKNDTDWGYSNHMTRIRLNGNLADSGYVSYYLHNLFQIGFFSMNCTHHVNQASINSTFLSNVIIPIPSLDEQEIIVSKIEKDFSVIENLEKFILTNMKQIHVLRESILKYAFEGKLVHQDPNNESAEILIEKIKREKELAIPTKKEKSKITKRKSIDTYSKQMRLV